MSVTERSAFAAASAEKDLSADAAPAGTGGGLVRRLLRIPLFYKLVIANGAITLVAVVAGAVLVASAMRRTPAAEPIEIILPVALGGVIIGILINALVVRVALTPLRNLEHAANEVRAGRDDARATESAMSDPGMEQVVRAFNAMLESVSLYRRRLRDVAIRAFDAGEAERKRLSGELHDNAAQSLTAILVQLRVTRAGLPPDKSGELAAIGEQIAQLINDLRAMAQQLRPPALDILGLEAAMLAHARTMSESTGVRVHVHVHRSVDAALTPEAELALYRVVQEALLNAVRHAQTNEARVDVHRKTKHLVVDVLDRGRGFDVDRVLEDGALGLIGMAERASYVGGRVDIDSRPGAGTRVRFTFPIKEAAHA